MATVKGNAGIYATERQEWFVSILRQRVERGWAKTGIAAEWGATHRRLLRSEVQREIDMLQAVLARQGGAQ